ncbi:hypothetical protein [Streptomyces sp. NPDC059957]|uniref:hypothetical protein n=1 Tax=Streptomyces sp. NPDC059957 TaxID=3347016 RepID=UPI0036469AFC
MNRLGAATENAQFQVRLLTDDPTLLALAASAFDAIAPIRAAATRTELANREQHLQDTLNTFITAATAHIR